MAHASINLWKNKDLCDYFEKVPLEVFQNYAIAGGIETGCDIDLAYPYIKNTHSLLEVGACYGRVLKHLISKGYPGKIYAIERSQNFFKHLIPIYGDTVNLIHADIQDFKPMWKVDAILWMWSDISGFPQLAQFPILQHLSQLLSPNGIFIVETILHTLTPKNATYSDGQHYALESEYGTVYGYIPSEKEMHDYGVKLGFQDIQHIHYVTPTGRERILHIFRRRLICA